MKKTLVILASLVAVLIAVAQLRPSKETRYQKSKIWYIATLPLWQPIWTVFHEGSHAVAFMSFGNEITSFKPYPHMRDDGRFLFGGVETECPDGICGKNVRLAGSLAPYILDTSVFLASDLVLSTGVVDSEGVGGGFVFVGGMLVPFADFVSQMNGVRCLDRKNIADALGVSPLTVTISADVLAVVGLWRIYVNGKRMFVGKSKTKSQVYISPNSAGVGAKITVQW